MFDRSPIEPGSTFGIEVILRSRSETPTEHVTVTLTADVSVAIPQGKTVAARQRRLAQPQTATWKPGMLGVGEHRQRAQFSIEPNTPPSYQAAAGWCRVAYLIEVHVAIPFWIDRRVHFAVPVASLPRMPLEASTATLVSTRPAGQTAGELYIEASLDATQLRPGDELRGDVTFANVNVKRIRRVTIAFAVFEHTREPFVAMNTVARWAATLVSGPPPEGESFPFHFVIPPELWPSFDAGLFAFRWVFEVRADVVLGADVVLSIPLDVLRTPPGVELPPHSRRALPVGRERLARMWTMVAERIGVSYDESESAMLATRGAVSMKLVREAFQGTLGIVAHYRYPHLGLDLHLGARSFLESMITRGRYESRVAAANQRFTIVGRDRLQLDAFFDTAILEHLASATSVVLDDDLAHVRVAGVANSASTLEQVARAALGLLELFAAAVARIPVPHAFIVYADAWRNFAASVGGRFEPGRMWIHDATIDGFRFEVGLSWEPADDSKPKYTVIQVPIEPPLAHAPHVDDALLSAHAREVFRELRTVEGFHATTTEIGIASTTITTDPATLLPRIEAMVTILRALRGVVAAGPFR